MNLIGEYIKNYRGDISLREFAKKCNISHTHLDSIEKGYDPRTGKPVSVTVETLKKIAKAMNMTINDLLIESGDVQLKDLQLDKALSSNQFDEKNKKYITDNGIEIYIPVDKEITADDILDIQDVLNDIRQGKYDEKD